MDYPVRIFPHISIGKGPNLSARLSYRTTRSDVHWSVGEDFAQPGHMLEDAHVPAAADQSIGPLHCLASAMLPGTSRNEHPLRPVV